jgi:hypothetical protein
MKAEQIFIPDDLNGIFNQKIQVGGGNYLLLSMRLP